MKLVSGFTASLALVAAHCLVASQPNIVFVLVDDMGYGDLGVYGNAGVKTPNLDRLAAEGILFEQFYATAPICSPSRAAFITGQYPQRWKITSFLSDRAANERRGMANFLGAGAPSLARYLQGAGYATAHFGKWHLGGQRNVDDAPLITEYGFDESLTQFEGLGDRILPEFSRPMEPNWKDGRHPLGVSSEKLGRGETKFVPRSSATSVWVERAIRFMKQSTTANKPFYVNVWPDDPHTPVEPSEAFRGDNSARSRYLGVLRELDRDLGVLFDFIRQDPALRGNTLIVFASDNGPEEGCGSAGGLRGSKGELYEGGIREPFIVWAPGLSLPGAQGTRDGKTLIVGHDLVPSLLRIARVAGPKTVSFDGRDVSEAMLGKGTVDRQAPVFWSRPSGRPVGPIPLPDLAMREGKWKFLCAKDGTARELFDLDSDPGETTNLATIQPLVADRMTATVLAWQNLIKR